MIRKCIYLTLLLPALALAARDGSGTYSLPTGNPVSSGQTITKDWANNTLSDIATALSDSLSRSGKGGMTVPFSVADGSSGGPAFTFTLAPTSGLYRDNGTGDVRVATSAAERMRWTSAGAQVTGSFSILKAGGTYSATLASPVLAASYTLTLPSALPAGPLPLKLDNTGSLTTAQIVASDVATGAVTSAAILDTTIDTVDLKDNSVTTAKIADAQITRPKVQSFAYVEGANTGGAATWTSGAELNLGTGYNVTISPTGGRVQVGIQTYYSGAGTVTQGFYIQGSTNAHRWAVVNIRRATGSSVSATDPVVCTYRLAYYQSYNGVSALNTPVGPPCIDTPGAGTFTYGIFGMTDSASTTAGVNYSKLVAREIL